MGNQRAQAPTHTALFWFSQGLAVQGLTWLPLPYFLHKSLSSYQEQSEFLSLKTLKSLKLLIFSNASSTWLPMILQNKMWGHGPALYLFIASPSMQEKYFKSWAHHNIQSCLFCLDLSFCLPAQMNSHLHCDLSHAWCHRPSSLCLDPTRLFICQVWASTPSLRNSFPVSQTKPSIKIPWKQSWCALLPLTNLYLLCPQLGLGGWRGGPVGFIL